MGEELTSQCQSCRPETEWIPYLPCRPSPPTVRMQEPPHVSNRYPPPPGRHSPPHVGIGPVRRFCPAGLHGRSQVRQAPDRQFPQRGLRRGRLQRRREARHRRRQFPLPGPRVQAAQDPLDQGKRGRAGQGLLQRLHERPLDVEGNGRPGIVSVDWFSQSVYYYRNTLGQPGDWPETKVDTSDNYECGDLADLEGKGRPTSFCRTPRRPSGSRWG